MNRFLLLVLGFTFVISCNSDKVTDNTLAKANKKQTEKAIKPLPKAVSNRISIKKQFVPDEEQEIFILDLKGENFSKSKLCFVILNKNRDTLFCRNNISGDVLLSGADDVNGEDEQIEYIMHHMSTFFSVKNFSNPPYTINDPNSDDFNGNSKVWSEIENDSTVTCFEFCLRPNGGAEVIAYSRLLDSIVVYDRTH